MIELLATDRLLLRLPSWLGDFVLAEPVVRSAQRALREGRIGAASLAAPARLLELLGGRFEDLARLPSDPAAAARAWRGHDLALLLDGSWRSALAAARAAIPVRVGPARGLRAPLLTHAVRGALERGATPLGLGRPGRFPRPLPRPFGALAAELATSIGLEVRERRPLLLPTPDGEAAVRARLTALGLAPDEPFDLVNAGARPGSAKGVPPELLVLWVRSLAERGRRVLLVCAPGEEGSARECAALARKALGGRVPPPILLDAPPPGLAELVALLARARRLLTADSGPRHLAVALGRPVVCAFGPTDPRHTADHTRETTAIRHGVPCGPCHRERCPLDEPRRHVCWHGIPPASWLEVLREPSTSPAASHVAAPIRPTALPASTDRVPESPI